MTSPYPLTVIRLPLSDRNLTSFLSAKTNCDAFVKSRLAALRCIRRHCGVPPSTPHSSGEFLLSLPKDGPCNWSFLQPVRKWTLYEFIKGHTITALSGNNGHAFPKRSGVETG